MSKKAVVLLVLLLSSIVHASPDRDYRVFREGYNYWRTGNALKAYAVFQSIAQPIPPIDDLRLYALGATALETGRPHVAKEAFEKLIAEYPQSPWVSAAQNKLSQQETPKEPIIESNDLEERATSLFRARDYKKAIPVLEELLQRNDRNDLPLMTMLASAYARSNRYDEAIAMQRRIAKTPSETRKAMYKIAFLQADRGHDTEAIIAAKEYLNQFPNGPDRLKLMWMIAWSQYRLKEWTSAISQFQNYSDSVGSHEEKARASYWMARSLDMMGNKLGAMTAYGVISEQDSGYYGHLASARLRHKPIIWQLPLHKKMAPGKLNADSATTLLASLSLYEFAPVAGWAGDYHSLVDKAAESYGLTTNLVTAIIYVESHNQPTVVSSAGAIGLMQLIPPTAHQMATEMHLDMFDTPKLRDTIWNVTLGMDYLAKLSKMFNRNLVALIASYNAGEQAVSRWMDARSISDPEMFIEAIPYDETQAYVKKVLMLTW